MLCVLNLIFTIFSLIAVSIFNFESLDSLLSTTFGFELSIRLNVYFPNRKLSRLTDVRANAGLFPVATYDGGRPDEKAFSKVS